MAHRPQFRPDIEGLRGIAILLVVLFHAGVPALAGGFVGVDVFFVLSGFFITALLVRETADTGTVDLTAFYARRALRLGPALLVVLAATLAAVMWLYAPIDRVSIASAARAVSLSAGNIEFARTAVDYFRAGENPLLHTWSLAVEEQFYAVWPLLFVAAAMVHERAGDDAKRPLAAWLGVAGAVSFVACLWVTRTAQPWAFFGMPTRLWEFALGGAVALATRRELSPRLGIALQVAGLVAIGVAVAAYDRVTPYPGVAALLPAGGALLLLVGGDAAPEGAASRLLGVAPLRGLGRLSYAWYLWHWPVMGVAGVLWPSIGVAGKVAWAVAALVPAWLTLRFVEEPARASRAPAGLVAGGALLASLAAALVATVALHAAERQMDAPGQRAFAAARSDRTGTSCWVNTVEEFKGACVLGDTASTTTIALLGDSHAEHWLAGLDVAGRAHGWRVDAMVKGGCPVAEMAEERAPRLARHYRECTRYREAMVRRIIALRPRAVILSSWDHYVARDGRASSWKVSAEAWEAGLRKTYSRLAAAGIPVIAFRDVPMIPFDAPTCLSRRAARLPFSFACTYARAAALSPLAVAAQDRAARGLAVRLVDMNDLVCARATCGVLRGDVVVFTDDNHVTASFSRSVAGPLGERIAAALGGQ